MNVERKNGWFLDRDTNTHYLPIDDDLAMAVYKTAAGDYAITCHADSAGCGGDTEYADRLPQAKKLAEKMKNDGSFLTLAPEL